MMMMIVLRLRSLLLRLLGLKSRWHRPFRPRPLNKVFFQGGGISVDSWTPGPKPLCHRRPTGPHPSGLLWTPAQGRVDENRCRASSAVGAACIKSGRERMPAVLLLAPPMPDLLAISFLTAAAVAAIAGMVRGVA